MKTKEQRELEDAQYEADRQRDRAEHLERQHRREQDEREQERKESARRSDPSNRLYNGDVTDFSEAIACHCAACNREIIPTSDDDLTEKCNQSMREGIANAIRAKSVYDGIMVGVKRQIVDALRKNGLEDWADCYEKDDYSSMAI